MAQHTDKLRRLALDVAAEHGLKLHRAKGRGQQYLSIDGQKVQLRTSLHRTLQVRASDEDPDRAQLDIEGSDILLFSVPTVKNGRDMAEVYLVPTSIAGEALRSSHRAWLDRGARTKGGNRTFSIWLDKNLETSDLYREKWQRYRIETVPFSRDS